MHLPFLSKPKDNSQKPHQDGEKALTDTSPKDPQRLSLEDAISPEHLEVDFNYLKINDRFFRTFYVSNYPRYVSPNWLEPLINFDHTLNISMFIYPSQS